MSLLLDPRVLDQLVEDLGAEDLLELAEQFLDALPGRVAALREAARSGGPDPDRAQARAAHTLKSTARLFGLQQLAEQAAALEASAPMCATDSLGRLTELADSSAEALRSCLATLGAREPS